MSDKALRLLELGLEPVLLGDRGDGLKRPLQANWQAKTTTTRDAAAWGARNNVGIRCGLQPSGQFLLVFDFDYEAAAIFPKWKKAINKIVPPQQLVVVTSGKGYHAYFYTQAEKAGRKLAMSEERETLVETIGRGRQIVTAGSLHPSGKRYKFASDKKYADIPTITDDQYTGLIAAAAAFDKRPQKTATVTTSSTTTTAVNGTGELVGLNCISYAEKYILPELSPTLSDGTPRTEKTESRRKNEDGEWVTREELYIHGYAGLKILTDGTGWYCFGDEIGGGLPELVAWHRKIPLTTAQAMTRPQCAFVIYPGEHHTTIQLSHGQFLGDVDIKLPQRAFLHANTGIGKTSYIAKIDGKVLLVVPTQALVEQLTALHPQATPFYQYRRDLVGSEQLIITTPDSLPKVLDKIDASDYTLAIDEAHLIAIESEAGFRRKAWDNVLNVLGGAWRGVVMMTGTPFPLVGKDLQIFDTVAVQSPARRQLAQRVVWQQTEGDRVVGQRIPAMLSLLPKPTEYKRTCIYLQNKRGQLDDVIFGLRGLGYDREQIGVINADSRESDVYKCLVEHETVPDTVRVIVTTSVISTGFNIKTPEDGGDIAPAQFEQLHLLSPVSSLEGQQLANRFRTGAVGRVYWYNVGEGRGSSFGTSWLANEALTTATAIANDLNRNEASNPDTDDVARQEWQKARLMTAARIEGQQLVVVDDDPIEGVKEWIPSIAAVNHSVFKRLKNAENTHPEIFKRNTAVFGWQWLEDAHLTVIEDKQIGMDRREYRQEMLTERFLWHEQLCFDLFANGYDKTAIIRRQESDRRGKDWVSAAGTAMRYHEEQKLEWRDAVQATLYGMGQASRDRKIKRQLVIQQTRPQDDVTARFYEVFSVGDRYTPDDLKERIEAIFKADSMLSIFIEPRYEGNDPITSNKAVRMMRDYFELKRCKIRTASGERVNGYEIVDDCPHVTLPDMGDIGAEYAAVRLDQWLPVSLSSSTSVKLQSETAIEPPPAIEPSTDNWSLFAEIANSAANQARPAWATNL